VRGRAFTLVELLVTIAIIAVLAALVFPASRAAAAAKAKNRGRAELRQVESYIEVYKGSLNYYPPSSGLTDPTFNPLYYELAGTQLSNGVYITLDSRFKLNAVDVSIAFRLSGFANSLAGQGSDDNRQPQNFFKGSLRTGQYLEIPVTNRVLKTSTRVVVLGSLVEGSAMLPGASGGSINPFGYNSASPTNNPTSYDLWLDIIAGGKKVRLCNWSDKPIKL
jgi:prepilin-type N-terminal cleavage/methylation domain-containing protein